MTTSDAAPASKSTNTFILSTASILQLPLSASTTAALRQNCLCRRCCRSKSTAVAARADICRPQHPAPPPLALLQQLLPATIDSHCHHLASSPLPATIASMNKLQQSQKCCHRRCSYHRHKHTTSTGTNPPHPEHSSTSPPPPMT